MNFIVHSPQGYVPRTRTYPFPASYVSCVRGRSSGTVYGFSVVDVGGNWLRISKLGDVEPEPESEGKSTKDLNEFINLAARLGDAHGDDEKAFKTLETGLKRFPNASAIDRARALFYHAELAARLRKHEYARKTLAAIEELGLSDEERNGLADDFAQTSALVAGD